MEWEPLLAWVEAHRWISMPAAAGALLLAYFIVVEAAARRRRAEIGRALDDSTHSTLKLDQRNRERLRLHATLQPPPDPFTVLHVEFVLRSRGPLGWLLGLFGLRRQHLAFYGMLRRRPAAEVVWERGHAPDRALGRGPDTLLWTAHRLDFLSGAYAVHGTGTAALEHAFVDLQTRFGAYTRRVVLQANTNPQLVVWLRIDGMNREDIPALVATVRTLARASLVE